MDIKGLAETLHPLEQKVLPYLDKENDLDGLARSSSLSIVEVMRALQWLENKQVLKISTEIIEVIKLDSNGKKYAEHGLPEKRFLQAVSNSSVSIKDIPDVSGLDDNESAVCLGVLKGKAAISLDAGIVSITEHGRKIVSKEWLEEALLKRLSSGTVGIGSLSPEEKFAYDVFRKRSKIVLAVVNKLKKYELTDLGKKLCAAKLDIKPTLERMTPQILREKTWKGNAFRHYDVRINVPGINAGRKHHYRAFLDSVRRKFMALGFKEMFGPVVESDFWDMDALFMPQFHSARDIHAAYYVKEPEYGKLDESIVEKVKQAHENGFGTSSKGWQYPFDVRRTHRLLLRTQGTACSARTLASKDLKIPGKYFATSKCFRYDVIDASHLPDFFQTEGIVVDEGLNFTHLKGVLKMFAEEFAQTTSFKIKPCYFPFTEPSAELHAKHPELGWIELGGSGIFRPELTKPLGVDVPVIAWGLGIDRVGMVNMGINDIRDLYTADLNKLKNSLFRY